MSKTKELHNLLSIDPDLDLRVAAEELGITYHGARGIKSRLQAKHGPTFRRDTAAKKPNLDLKVEKVAPTPVDDRKAAAARRLAKAAKDAEQHTLTQQEVREKIFGLVGEPAAPPTWVADPNADHSVTGTPVAIWSDWHLGENVELPETNGINAFNMAIADARIRRLVSTTIELGLEHMVNPTYPGIVVCLGGDMVTGEIHDELTRTNDLDPFPTVIWARDRIVAGLRSLADAFGRVFVPCVAGNHGRVSRRVEHKHFAVRNFDWLISTLCEKYFKDIGDDRVRFFIPESNEAMFEVQGHKYLLLHGHDLGCSGGDGIIGSLGPIMRGRMKVGNQRRSVGSEFDTLVVGHWHQYIQLRGLIVNGSLKGFDGFANAGIRAAAEPATQALWFTHPKYGITARWPILLQPGVPAVKKEWVSWQA